MTYTALGAGQWQSVAAVRCLAWPDPDALVVVVVKEAELPRSRTKQSRAEQSFDLGRERGRGHCVAVALALALAWCCFLVSFFVRRLVKSASRSLSPSPFTFHP